jgi:hypothetical protein
MRLRVDGDVDAHGGIPTQYAQQVFVHELWRLQRVSPSPRAIEAKAHIL